MGVASHREVSFWTATLSLTGLQQILTHHRTVTAVAFSMSVLVYTHVLPYSWIMFTWQQVLQIPPQIWRLPTSFLLTGPGLGMLFDPFMLYRGLVELEMGNSRFRSKEDVVWYLICVSLLTIVSVLPRSSCMICLFSECCIEICTSTICPPSAHQLKRFLKSRKISSASRPPVIRKIRVCCGVDWWDAYMDGLASTYTCPGGFLSALHFSIPNILIKHHYPAHSVPFLSVLTSMKP